MVQGQMNPSHTDKLRRIRREVEPRPVLFSLTGFLHSCFFFGRCRCIIAVLSVWTMRARWPVSLRMVSIVAKHGHSRDKHMIEVYELYIESGHPVQYLHQEVRKMPDRRYCQSLHYPAMPPSPITFCWPLRKRDALSRPGRQPQCTCKQCWGRWSQPRARSRQ